MAEGIALDQFRLVCLRIIDGLAGPEEPVLTVAYRRVEIQVFEELEARQTDIEVVVHTVLETVCKGLSSELFLELARLEVDLVLERGTVAE